MIAIGAIEMHELFQQLEYLYGGIARWIRYSDAYNHSIDQY